MTALTDAPDLFEVPEDEEARAQFTLLNDRMANWAMRRARDYARKAREVEENAEVEMDLIIRWKETETAKHQAHVRFFEGILAAYLMRVRADPEDGRKSVSTPYGKVASRQAPDKWEVDPEVVLDWARQARPDLIRTVQSLSLGDAKKTLVACRR